VVYESFLILLSSSPILTNVFSLFHPQVFGGWVSIRQYFGYCCGFPRSTLMRQPMQSLAMTAMM